jgi:hypothetical protein
MTTWTHSSYGYKAKGCRCDICRAAYRQSRTRARSHANDKRDEQGVIATLVDTETGATVSLHRMGLARDAVRAVAAYCDTLGETWKVQCLSTPRTIMRDLTGVRAIKANGRVMEAMPEVNLLGQVGRRDLLSPRLFASSVDPRDY